MGRIVVVDRRCWPVLIHQLLALALATDGVTVEDAWAQLSRVPDFRGIPREEFDRLLDWMLHDQSLRLASGRLVLGPKAERRFGRRNFMELYAVFSSPQTYTVQTTAGEPLGTLNQSFVDRLVDEVSCFLLGGRAWVTLRLEHQGRRVVVERAPRGREPSWGGFLPQFLGYEVCERIRLILADGEVFGYLDPEANKLLASQRDAMQGVVGAGAEAFEASDGEIRWWTFAGGRINSTLRYAIQAISDDWTVVPSNFWIRVRGEDLDAPAFRACMKRLGEPMLWQDEALWMDVAESLPNYRMSKFQSLMPEWVEREVLARYLLDVQGARHWLRAANLGSVAA